MADGKSRRRPIAWGMSLGLVGGFIFAVLYGADSRLSATSGFAIGAVIGALFVTSIVWWIKLLLLVSLIGILIFTWL